MRTLLLTRRSLAALLALCLALLLGHSPALARPTDEAEAEAKSLFAAGKEHYRLEQYVGALASFAEALKLVRRSSALLMVAHSYRRLGLPDQALAHYQQYLAAWAAEKPGTVSPHRSVVQDHIQEMQQVIDETKRGEELMKTDPRGALAYFEPAYRQLRGPRIQADMAVCYERLRARAKAERAVAEAIAYWEKFRSTWRSEAPPGAIEPPEVRNELARLRRLERRIATSPSYYPGSGDSGPEPARKPGTSRSVGWLAAGVCTGALTVGFEIFAWVSFSRGNQEYSNSPDLSRYRDMTIAGHVVAGTMAVASVVSWILYARSGKPRPEPSARVVVLPGPREVLVSGALRF
jgi:tetratricopeptide (TPR) repeat protein